MSKYNYAYRVSVKSQLNFRAAPAMGDNVITRLSDGDIVLSNWGKKQNGNTNQFVKVKYSSPSGDLVGFVWSKHIDLIGDALDTVVVTGEKLKAAYLEPINRLTPSMMEPYKRHLNLSGHEETLNPQNAYLSEYDANVFAHQVNQYLDVENSPRYRRKKNATYCNIFASDFVHCYFGNWNTDSKIIKKAYLPRVWWDNEVLTAFKKDEKVNLPQPYLYGNKRERTVYEMNANSLNRWLSEYGKDFGWTQHRSPESAVDEITLRGGIGLISSANIRESSSGHISVILPPVAITNKKISAIPQAQAGATNMKLFYTRWWLSKNLKDTTFWSASLSPLSNA